MLATTTAGVYTQRALENNKPETITTVTGIEHLRQEIGTSKSSHGTGGMQSKIEAAVIAQTAGIETWIVNGLKDNFITDAITGLSNHTKIK